MGAVKEAYMAEMERKLLNGQLVEDRSYDLYVAEQALATIAGGCINPAGVAFVALRLLGDKKTQEAR